MRHLCSTHVHDVTLTIRAAPQTGFIAKFRALLNSNSQSLRCFASKLPLRGDARAISCLQKSSDQFCFLKCLRRFQPLHFLSSVFSHYSMLSLDFISHMYISAVTVFPDFEYFVVKCQFAMNVVVFASLIFVLYLIYSHD